MTRFVSDQIFRAAQEVAEEVLGRRKTEFVQPRQQIAPNWVNVPQLKNAILYSVNNYNNAANITFHDGTNYNVPLYPGITIDAEPFDDGDVYATIQLLIHEPLHDWSQYGFDGIWPCTHIHIGQIVGPSNTPPGGSYFDKVWDLLHKTKCGGKSLWEKLKDGVGECNCGPKPD